MTFLRRVEQFVHTPKWHEIEPPVDFVEQAYAAGLVPGTGTVRFYVEAGYTRATLNGTVGGRRQRFEGLGLTDEQAGQRLLAELRKASTTWT